MGMAMATNPATPNFLFTHKDKDKLSNTRRINRGICAACAAGVLVCIGTAFWQERQIQARDTQKIGLQTQLSAFQVRVDRNLILKLVDQSAPRKSIQASAATTWASASWEKWPTSRPTSACSISAKLGAAGNRRRGQTEPPKGPFWTALSRRLMSLEWTWRVT
jgi:hypothetical protein